MGRTGTALSTLCLLALLLPSSHAADQARQDEVRARSASVMPFDLAATSHEFTKTPTGGLQRVVAKQPGDGTQVQLIRAHLRDIAAQFARRDFAGPTAVHGAAMPGLAELRAAPPGQLQVRYREIPAGAEVRYTSGASEVVAAVHRWFDAQLADHGTDAVAGHDPSLHHPH